MGKISFRKELYFKQKMIEKCNAGSNSWQKKMSPSLEGSLITYFKPAKYYF
jgi:hypothetical protein